MINPWQVLGVHQKMSDEEIHQAFRDLAYKLHPDRPTGNKDKFSELVMAYGLLKTRAARRQFVDLSHLYGPRCPTCGGTGGKSKAKSITEKKYIVCKTCFGAGYLIEKKETRNTIITV